MNRTDQNATTQPDAAGESGRRRPWSPRRLWPLLVIGTAIAAFFALDLQHYASLEGLDRNRVAWQAFVQAHYALAALIYTAAFTAIVLCAIPVGLWMTLIGGFLFGAAAAVPMAILASTIGATLMFVAARSVFPDRFEAKAGSRRARLEDGFRRDRWSYMFFLRLVPIFPFCTVTIVPALIGVDLLCFTASTFFGLIPVTAIFAMTGASIGAVLDAGALSLGTILTPQLIVALVGLGVIAILPALVKRLRRGSS